MGCKNKPDDKQDVVNQVTNSAQTSQKSDEMTESKKSIMFFGDSLTAGFGLSEEQSFPSLIQQRIDSLNLSYQIINAGLSGETSAGGLGRIDWVLQQSVDIFVLELGANDMLRGLALDNTVENLSKIIEKVKAINPNTQIIVAGMQAPPNMGQNYTERFSKIFKDLSSRYDAGLIPFLLDGVAGVQSLNLSDGKHPNAKGQLIVLENVWSVLETYLVD